MRIKVIHRTFYGKEAVTTTGDFHSLTAVNLVLTTEYGLKEIPTALIVTAREARDDD